MTTSQASTSEGDRVVFTVTVVRPEARAPLSRYDSDAHACPQGISRYGHSPDRAVAIPVEQRYGGPRDAC